MSTDHSTKDNKNVLWIVGGLTAGAGALALARQRRNRARAAAWNRQMDAAPPTALVTGASSGIGAAYARQLAGQGYGLVLVARREARLKELAAELEERYGVQVEVLAADLSTEAGIARVEARLACEGARPVDFLVNNAGYDVLGPFADIQIDQTLALINCLLLACVRLSRAALPGMLARGRGAIINVSSIGAFVAKPKDSTYVSSKAYLNLFSESLAAELADTGVRVQALCPGFTHTGFHDTPGIVEYRVKERLPGWLWMTSKQVVEASLRALAQDQRVCIPGWKNRLITAAGRSGLSNLLIGILGSFFPRAARSAWAEDLNLLACPHCRGSLERKFRNEREEMLLCRSCGREYPVRDGIPRFLCYEELNSTDRDFARFYDWFSYVYLPFSRIASAFLGGEARLRRELLDRLEPRGGRVLEVSIGPGVNLPYLAANPEVGEIYGLDISAGQLQRCQGYAFRRGYSVSLYQGNAEALPFQDESFDSVFHIGGINFFSDRRKAITEMIRVAKPGTRILIADETERGARGYELGLPGFRKLFGRPREPVRPPVDLVPPEMLEIRLDESAWRGWFYCLEFRKPDAR